MSQSTIYRRNLRRLARSEENIRDIRPPIIRVIAAMPVFGYIVSKMQGTNQHHVNALGSDSSYELKTDAFSNIVEDNNSAAPLVIGTTMLASFFTVGARSSIRVPMAMLSPHVGLPSPIYLSPQHALRMRAAPSCCAVLMAASFVMRSTKSTISKL